MPANTPKGFPYPVGTDRVMDGDDSIHNLATAVDTKVGLHAAGVTTIASASMGVPTSIAVTFPVGRFTAVPVVVTNCYGTANPQAFATGTSTVSATAFTISAVRITSNGAINIAWHAVQV